LLFDDDELIADSKLEIRYQVGVQTVNLLNTWQLGVELGEGGTASHRTYGLGVKGRRALLSIRRKLN